MNRKHSRLSRAKHALILGLIGLVWVLIQSCVVKGPPAWTRQVPAANDFYIGVGSAQKTAGSSDHIARARDIALEQIAAGIAVTISGQTTQQILEQTGLAEESFDYTIQSKVIAELEGYELMDSWENADEYWVYYRLSKTRYRLLLECKKQAAAKQATDWHAKGTEEWKRENITSALQYLLKANHIIKPYRGMEFSASDQDIQLQSDLRDLLSAIHINCEPSEIKAVSPGNPIGKTTIRVAYTSADGKQLPVKGMPLAVTLNQGKSIFSQIAPTDANGISILEINQVTGPEKVWLMVAPNLQAFLANSLTGEYNEFGHLPLPSQLVTIETGQTRVMVMAREYNLEKPVSPLMVAGQMKQYLTSYGWIMVNQAHMADYLITINATTSPGVERQGIHTAFAKGDFSVINNQTMEEILKKTFINISGGGLNYESAGEQALTNLGEKMVEEFRDVWK
jgi:hypothetical protein